jgi:hypothetical protein
VHGELERGDRGLIEGPSQHICLEGLTKPTKKIKDSQCPSRATPEYKARTLPVDQPLQRVIILE